MFNWEIYEESFKSFRVTAVRHKVAHEKDEYNIFIGEIGSHDEILKENASLSKYKELINFLKKWDK